MHKETLDEHSDPIAAKANLPQSQIDVDECIQFVSEKKDALMVVANDIKDAKRRIAAARGPQKKKKETKEEESASDPGSDSE